MLQDELGVLVGKRNKVGAHKGHDDKKRWRCKQIHKVNSPKKPLYRENYV
jgi:hypothetical protein